MNFAIAVFGVMLVIAVAFWFIQGNRTYLQTEDAIASMVYAHHLEMNQLGNDDSVPAVQAPVIVDQK
ncbi:hypothetical protein N7471_005185 [Penicillium samsonianum]|uniref:uncharacterized protein n=1 Tax=Penicillium samsonianum TaxID=1882272 RepID=UPI002546ED08|nr:uncharacterized protein N7471_005185 [Penicillium samsonianum]KAJ6138699.1 hypothetical protein N7471_005185 [Penicillium samsonianum]